MLAIYQEWGKILIYLCLVFYFSLLLFFFLNILIVWFFFPPDLVTLEHLGHQGLWAAKDYLIEWLRYKT